MSKKTIYVSQGQERYCGGLITETTGKNISADPIVVVLGSKFPPPAKNTAVAPDSDTSPDLNTRLVKLLIDSSTPAGAGQYVWAWITDNPEVEPIILDGPIDVV